MKLIVLLMLISFSALSADLKLDDYDWYMTDIAERGYTKESLFKNMDRAFIKKGSICSNRALIWSNNFKRQQQLDTGKIFLFYTKKKGDLSLKTWWYHVSPIVNEGGKIWVMDAGFGSYVPTPLEPIAWLKKFANSTNCKEIKASETELVERIFNAQVFPHDTQYGHYDCYYKFTPHTIWTPEVLAQNLLGVNAQGQPVRVERNEIHRGELYQACLEAAASGLGRILGSSKKKCQEYVGLDYVGFDRD